MSVKYTEDKVNINGVKYVVYNFTAPMSHEDWHEAEESNLKYVGYDHNGPDFWDDVMVFCKESDLDIIQKWHLHNF